MFFHAYQPHCHYGRAHHDLSSTALPHCFAPPSHIAGIVFIFLVAGFLTRRFTFKSRWAFLLFHVVVRLGAQGVGIGLDQHGVISSTGLALLKAFITLSAEVGHTCREIFVAASYSLSLLILLRSAAPQGYLTLVLCILRQLISWQRRAFGHSWVHGRSDKSYLKLTYKEASQSPEFIFDLVRSQRAGRDKAYSLTTLA
jgi:hypothetical protein